MNNLNNQILSGKQFKQVETVKPNEEKPIILEADGKPIIGYIYKVVNPKKKVIIRQAFPTASDLNLKKWTVTFYNFDTSDETVEIYPIFWNA
ncbi:hypothetical protein [Bacillus sp. NMTD17]|uniref:hypothetical protein n=1 Tax=Bacillus sp. NMTD17 TaxID=2108547 RepID=UPI000D037331|nr:hypothetical protein [Bacillus sp. NMTD17]PRS67564.1 hypothetical protein C6347_15905 [Bacillus sp. NMTD17]